MMQALLSDPPATLSDKQISGVDFHSADLRFRDLSGIIFRNCEFRKARLDWSDLAFSNLRQARLLSACLDHAHLRGACLRGANLRGATMFAANLMGADMTGACLLQADLREVNLCGARCLWGDTSGTKFAGAVYDRTTLLPPGFYPEREGMTLAETGPA